MHKLKFALTLAAVVASGPALADTTEARCDIYPAGSDTASKMIPCQFSQRQGTINIVRGDGVQHDLVPTDDVPGNFQDQNGKPVYRQSGLGDAGLIFRFENESVYVYWSTAGLNPPTGDDNPTAPYTTENYDATTLLRCGPLGAPEGTCAAGILRMEDRQASIVVTGPGGDEFTFNFLSDGVNATNREVNARLEGDTWIVDVNGKETYEVPLAAIEGG